MSEDVEIIARKLTKAECDALAKFPDMRQASQVSWRAAVSYGDLWRKLTKHRPWLEALEVKGIVERRVSRGETLWRPTRPLGLAVRAHLKGMCDDA